MIDLWGLWSDMVIFEWGRRLKVGAVGCANINRIPCSMHVLKYLKNTIINLILSQFVIDLMFSFEIKSFE